jgi:Domain of unknown function (DUF4394)
MSVPFFIKRGGFVCMWFGLLLALLSANANAVVLFGYVPATNRLISFNSATPATLPSNVALTGLAGTEVLNSMEFRPKTGELYAFAQLGLSSFRLVKINPISGVVSGVGTAQNLPSGVHFGMAFDPVADHIRFVSNTGSNLRINPDTGTIITPDTQLSYASSDPNFGVTPNVVHVAHSSVFEGAVSTTLYGIDWGASALVRIGGVNGSPSPGTGKLTTIGLLGFTISEFGASRLHPKAMWPMRFCEPGRRRCCT